MRIDETLEESFPASDPPSWSAGIAILRPASDAVGRAREEAERDARDAPDPPPSGGPPRAE